jgi:hypothetical protein
MPSRRSASATELATCCPFVADTYAVDHPLLTACPNSGARQAHIPADWDWVIDDARRRQSIQLELFPGLRDYYAASDRRLRPAAGRTVVTGTPPGYRPHQQLRLELPDAARSSAARRLAEHGPGPRARRIAIMPAGSSDASQSPSVTSWLTILDALADAFPDLGIVLVGKHGRDGRTATALGAAGLSALLAHRSRPLDGFDLPLLEQLAIVEACDVFLARRVRAFAA